MTAEEFKAMLDDIVRRENTTANFVVGVPDAIIQIDVFDPETGERYVGAEALSYLVDNYYKEG